ncbi:MAG: aspartyl protease family protein [Isosphaeraceae bacterium]
MVRYTYNQQVSPPAPFVHVSVRPPYEGAVGITVPAQIDTAADLSVIPGRLVDELQLVPLDSVAALGFGGHLLTLPTYLVELRVRELDPVTVKALASPDEPYALLGRDVLNQFTIWLDGPNLVLELR